MPQRTIGPPYDRFLATAEAVIEERPQVDPGMIREIFREVATTLDDGLALDGIDDHDAELVVAGLCEDLATDDPAAALRTRAALPPPTDVHEPDAVTAAYLTAIQLLQI